MKFTVERGHKFIPIPACLHRVHSRPNLSHRASPPSEPIPTKILFITAGTEVGPHLMYVYHW